MSEEQKNAIDELKSMREYFEFQPEGCNWRLSFNEEEVHTIIDVIINLIDKQQKEIEKLKTDKKNASEYIREEMYVDENPTLDDDNTITELPISLSLCNEDLRKLLELLEEE